MKKDEVQLSVVKSIKTMSDMFESRIQKANEQIEALRKELEDNLQFTQDKYNTM